LRFPFAAETAAGKKTTNMKVPGLRSSYEKVGGIVFFGRMLDKIRLRAAGRLPSEYFTGTANRTHFDSRCTRFLRIDYKAVADRVLQGGSDEEILEWCFRNGYRPSDDEIEIWNEFMTKRGWHDGGSVEFQQARRDRGFAEREDIQTWFDLQCAEERDDTAGS
jgi:gluconokinase